MKRLSKNDLKVQNLVRRKVNLQTLAPKKQHMRQFEDDDLPQIPAVLDSNNTLGYIYAGFLQLSNMFREKVCEECNYSVPTFYRKIRGDEKSLSNAEREKFKSIEKEIIIHMMGQAGMRVGGLPGEAA